MTLIEAYRDDLRELVARLDENGAFAPGEREAWDEGIEEADQMSELMMTGEALHKAMVGREGVDEVVKEHTEERTQAFV
ncbi:hypothetical protein [Halorubrum sp. GN11GM_10-3_MGM]|uniref:hypothetical protein n=1 Tax=Halorubrum sp. GN11GM_10-3_MGM TaxID=2518111 RepID=UPI0010F59CFF|nr:hypothetical protein [Halorubrum sp. GN11GM_10-3_MGM]TKX70961.1 hypothetical protein EXE40_08680 [Halorubrum sp. GN11GM_10-3_MGM]